jgi:hypothetical protein
VKRVKVVKAEKNSYWYASEIGKCFDVVEINKYGSQYKVVDKDKYFAEGDAVVVSEPPNFPFKVRCINNSGAEEELCVGHVYEVLSNYSMNNYVLKGVRSCYHQDRFEIVEENVVQESKGAPVQNKYMREVKKGVWIDVYDVLRAWEVTDPCLQHLLKKALQPGKRHHKDLGEDLKDILASAKRAVEMFEEWNQEPFPKNAFDKIE